MSSAWTQEARTGKLQFVLVRFWGTRGSIATPGPTRSATAATRRASRCARARHAARARLRHRHPGRSAPRWAPRFDEMHSCSATPTGTTSRACRSSPRSSRPGHMGTSTAPRHERVARHTLATQMRYPYFPVTLARPRRPTSPTTTLSRGRSHIARRDRAHRGTSPSGARRSGIASRRRRDRSCTSPTTSRRSALGTGRRRAINGHDDRHVARTCADVATTMPQYGPEEYSESVAAGHSRSSTSVESVAADVGTTVLFHHDPSQRRRHGRPSAARGAATCGRPDHGQRRARRQHHPRLRVRSWRRLICRAAPRHVLRSTR